MWGLTSLLAYEDALDINRLYEVAEQGSLVSKHLPLGEFVCDRHADDFRSSLIDGGCKN